ncbi:hypothetical protein FisN_10Lh291 [Fistulifera solaris]|uniref:F-box domain-containing protein n=1 Tax=Fistulifera solaris TaxID=1519565 RepID=A0A1Z5KG98_FISSO|nr:hypothetical protein FisN_10Lh291 [Fistulifera solaris]|eukprot:GAX25091.1 hypothetical protein FisN_10Lh291 [Fistulifera solaris]
MTPLLDTPDDLFSNYILKSLTVADLCRLRRVCRKFHDDSDRNIILKEFMARDEALTLSQQYASNSAILSLFNCRERVIWFERCSAYAWEMTRQALRHQSEYVLCRDPDCPYVNLHARVPRIANGLRNGKNYMFFAQFTCQEKLLWEGFLQDYNPLSDLTSPIRELIAPAEPRNTSTALVDDVLDDRFVDFYDNFVIESDVRFHLDARNVTNLTKDRVRSDLHVTLISLIDSPDGSSPELRLHYSSGGIQLEYPEPPSLIHSISIDVLEDQYVMTHYRKHDAYATPFLLWSAENRLFTVSMLYNFEHVREADQRASGHDVNIDDNIMDLLLAMEERFLGNHHDEG